MSAPRPHEVLAALRALEDLASGDPLNVRGVLATLVTIDGSLGERPGASCVIADDAASGCGEPTRVGHRHGAPAACRPVSAALRKIE